MRVGDKMDDIVQKFITEVTRKFDFLEKEYGYKKIEGKLENQDFYPDAKTVIRYIGKSVGIEVYWYFAGANIGVVFIELQNGEIPINRIFFGESKDATRAINLYSLAGLLKQKEDNLFLLKEVDYVTISKIKKREKVINENMSGIIEGLSNAVKKLATKIITGDTSIFTDVMNYQAGLIKKQYS